MALSVRLAGHPVHPMLVHFPIVLWTGAVATDVSGWLSGYAEWWTLSFGCLALGNVIALAAMLAGFLDYASIPRPHPARDVAVSHMLAMSTAWLIFLVSLALRGFPPKAPGSLWVTAVAVGGWCVMAFGGWLGGQLVYRFGVGVNERRLA